MCLQIVSFTQNKFDLKPIWDFLHDLGPFIRELPIVINRILIRHTPSYLTLFILYETKMS